MYTILYAITIPDVGGNTFIADMTAAYDRMPLELKRKIEGSLNFF